MATFLLTFTVAFILLLFIGFFISFSKRRQRRTNHGLTGMCHETGGEMCGGCSSYVLNIRPQNQDRLPRSCCGGAASVPNSRND